MMSQKEPKEPWIKLNFDQSLLCGIKELDKEHEELYVLASELLQTYLANPKNSQVSQYLKTIRLELSAHFEHEENHMEQNGFPGLKDHRQNHGELIAKADSLLASYENGLMTFGDLYEFLSKEMIHEHIGKVDSAFHEFLKTSGPH